jgi:NAD(P)-dependent dehydrogenase (short-subunit alcohol dehydrogenase family)
LSLTLDDHHAVVVGGAGALGEAICRAYADAGAHVSLYDLDLGAAERVVASLGEGHHCGPVDVTDPAAVERAAGEVGLPDSVVYCAGVAFTAEARSTDWDQYRRLMAINLDGAFYVAGAFSRRMVDAGRDGSFIFMSSTAGLRGEAGASAYCASKFGINGLMESVAAELSPAGIRANAVAPGNVDSPMLRSVAENQAAREGTAVEEMVERYAHAGAAVRLVDPAEVGATVVWLASPLASGVTGLVVRVDAGQMIG